MPQELTAAAPLSLPAFCVALGCADGVWGLDENRDELRRLATAVAGLSPVLDCQEPAMAVAGRRSQLVAGSTSMHSGKLN